MSVRIINAEVMDGLAQLPDESVHCVVTSPPYWGLRDYGTASWQGGDVGCIHEPPQEWIDHNFNANSAFGNGAKTQSAAAKSRWYRADGSCRCGATRVDKQLGLEPTLGEHIEAMVRVFREVRRVLRKDGTLWLNYGDSYASSGLKGSGGTGNAYADKLRIKGNDNYKAFEPMRFGFDGLKPKDLCGVPWRVAFALQAEGWWLRQDIIWSKPNPMPESIKDRCTKAHEYLFLLAKSERYYFDAEAIAEELSVGSIERYGYSFGGAKSEALVEANKSGVGQRTRIVGDREAPPTRNKRSVWEIATQPFPEAHFATFPPALIEPCIKAGCPLDGTVLDPFGGSGTTGLVADRLKRNAILIELNPAYAAMAQKRIANDNPLFTEVSVA
jgi:DNA modification methylase